MHDNAPVADKRSVAGRRAREQIHVDLAPGAGCHLAVFASEVTGLAGSRGLGVAGWLLAAGNGVEVGEGCSAGAVGGNGVGVDVVEEGAAGGLVGEVVEGDVDDGAGAVGVGRDCDETSDAGALLAREGGGIAGARDIVGYLGSGGKVCGGSEGHEAKDTEGGLHGGGLDVS